MILKYTVMVLIATGDIMSDIIKDFNREKCACGKAHLFDSRVLIGKGVISHLPDILTKMNAKKAFVLADKNTYGAAGDAVCRALKGFKISLFVFDKDALEPDETSVGLAVMHYPADSDVVIGVGSGVINDIGKIIAATACKPYIIVGTAPSMDGYASATSSMTRNGLKISLNSKCADVIIGDTDVLCNAPIKMMASGIGDMLAKYVSICEWRISHLINGEYYCPDIAALVRDSLKKCSQNADKLIKRDPVAVQAVFEGLVVCGVAMKYAGLSRPASGVEHYMSHVWDMRGAEFSLPVELHGVQCALGTLMATRLYEKLLTLTPDRQRALNYVASFEVSAWHEKLRELLGKGAESMIALEEKEGKYDKNAHAERLEKIITHWDDIKAIIRDELLPSSDLEKLMLSLDLPTRSQKIGVQDILPDTLRATKDIRDKYVLSRLLWDIGELDEFCKEIEKM